MMNIATARPIKGKTKRNRWLDGADDSHFVRKDDETEGRTTVVTDQAKERGTKVAGFKMLNSACQRNGDTLTSRWRTRSSKQRSMPLPVFRIGKSIIPAPKQCS